MLLGIINQKVIARTSTSRETYSAEERLPSPIKISTDEFNLEPMMDCGDHFVNYYQERKNFYKMEQNRLNERRGIGNLVNYLKQCKSNLNCK